jgi:hypothetical protein
MKAIIFFLFSAICINSNAQDIHTYLLINGKKSTSISALKISNITVDSNNKEYEKFELSGIGCKVTEKEGYWTVLPSSPDVKSVYINVSAKIDGEMRLIFRNSFVVQ